MEVAKLVAKYEGKGFSRERAEINALMEGAVFAIFRGRFSPFWRRDFSVSREFETFG